MNDIKINFEMAYDELLRAGDFYGIEIPEEKKLNNDSEDPAYTPYIDVIDLLKNGRLVVNETGEIIQQLNKAPDMVSAILIDGGLKWNIITAGDYRKIMTQSKGASPDGMAIERICMLAALSMKIGDHAFNKFSKKDLGVSMKVGVLFLMD